MLLVTVVLIKIILHVIASTRMQALKVKNKVKHETKG